MSSNARRSEQMDVPALRQEESQLGGVMATDEYRRRRDEILTELNLQGYYDGREDESAKGLAVSLREAQQAIDQLFLDMVGGDNFTYDNSLINGGEQLESTADRHQNKLRSNLRSIITGGKK